MAKTQAEIKAVITELERDGQFDRIKTKGERFEDQLYATSKYQAELVAALSAEITTRVPLPSHRPSVEARQATGLLAQSMAHHVEPSGMRKMDERRADKLEVYFAHLGLTLVQPIQRATGRVISVAPYAGWWLEANPFKLPSEEGERDSYRRKFKPFSLKLVDWRTLRFLPDDNGRPVVAARKFEMPMLRFLETYKKGTDPSPAVICDQEFPFLRVGRGQDPDSGNIMGQKVSVWIVDDGATICHFVDMKGEYHQVGYAEGENVGDYPNPWGRTSLTLITGSYNPDARDIENMYEGLLWEMMGQQFNLDVMASHAASIALNPPKRGVVPDKEVLMSILESDKPLPAMVFKDGAPTLLWGDPADFTTDADVTLKDLIAYQVAERDACLLPGILTNPDESTVKESTAAAFLNAGESADRLLDAARNSIIQGVTNVYESVVHYHTQHWNKPNQPKEAREAHYVRVLGTENVKGKALSDRKGEELELGPEDFEDFDIEQTLEITPAARTPSQKAAQYQLTRQQVQDGVKTPSQLIEVDMEDASGQEKKLEVFRRYQLRKPMIENMGIMYDLEFIKDRYGMDFSALFLQTPQGQAQMGGAMPNGNGMNVNTTAPPPTSVPDTGVTV